ncbi:MAG: heme o synthase [Phycisphaeraceae bacterium]|nr:heme o synthase [Phycisphaeraceae bacterium]MBX3366825.1 heme o synthase [Phycisphaeraceae bacterium]
MTQHPSTITSKLDSVGGAVVVPRSFWSAIVATTKPGITRLVTITALVGFAMAALGRGWTSPELVLALCGCAVGTFLSAAGANALNQWLERDRDARMPRTAMRPIPAGQITASAVRTAGLSLCALGLLTLWLTVGMIPMLVSLACMLSYILAYTPLKTRTVLATLVGTIPGSLPPLIGWTSAGAVSGDVLAPGGVSLFVLMTIWQLPHFWAIAWLYREDYAHGGYRVLPMIDPSGRKTAAAIVLTSIALLPATLWPAWAMPELLGALYMSVAGVTGLAFLALALSMARDRSRKSARRLFFASIIHLPLLLIAMVLDAFVHAFL